MTRNSHLFNKKKQTFTINDFFDIIPPLLEVIIFMKKLENLAESDKKLSELLKNNNVEKLNLISVGNSIASGYSWMDITKPLLYRDERIESIMAEKGIVLKRYHFARYANNNDEHVYSWFTRNISEEQMNYWNRVDTNLTRVIGLTEALIEKYYPHNPTENVGIRDIILSSNPNLANIVIYNGATGSFLDNVTRNGKHKLTTGIKRDSISIEATLKDIQISNRFNRTNTQVYLCGAPRILNTPVTDIFINSRLKKIASNYANVTYVPPIPRKVLYHSPEYGISPDTHYDEEEYIVLLNQIIQSITTNYLQKKAMIDIDRDFFNASRKIESGLIIDKDSIIEDILKEHLEDLNMQGIDCNLFLLNLKSYLLERQPYDFYYIGNDTIKKQINQLKK